MNEIKNDNLQTIEKYKKHRYSLAKRKNTVDTDVNAIRKLGKKIKNKDFQDLKEEDLKEFFIDIKDFIIRDHYASRIICFYKWFFKLKDDERPEIMKWYKYSKTSDRERQKDPNIKKELITAGEYKEIIQKVKMDLRISALYETLYLSGARPDEICNMSIEDVINDGGKISIIVNKSKSIPREIPLTEKPSLLLRWLENHPYKENKKAWLFISLDRRFKNRPITASSLSTKFKELKKQLDVKQTLILYSFRKTRATIMFNQGYDDKEMGLLFGWKPHTVIDRRNQYDLRGLEDLKNKIFQKAEAYKTREQLEEENRELVEEQKDMIEDLKEKVELLEKEIEKSAIKEKINDIIEEEKLIEKIKKEIYEEMTGKDKEKIRKEIEEEMKND